MKAHLMYPDRDFDLLSELPWQTAALMQDLELDTLLDAMAQGDKLVRRAAQHALLAGMTADVPTILFRQAVLQDCLAQPAVIRELYGLADEALRAEKQIYFGYYGRLPSGILGRAVEVLHMLAENLRRLRQIADAEGGHFSSAGFRALLAMLQRELDDDFFERVGAHLRRLKLHNGVLVSAELGAGNKGHGYTLIRPQPGPPGWLRRLLARRPPAETLTLHERDDNGARALAELRDRGINQIANVLAQSADHILSFLARLRTELAFYIGGVNLEVQLAQLGAARCFADPAAVAERRLTARGLYDICLALTMQRSVVANDVQADGKALLVITGANQGGKTTFLRSVGLAQLMTQCGLFAPAQALTTSLCAGLFTHFKRQEDAALKSGKLDEELSRMSAIVDGLRPGALVLLNESFAATNVREGSEIARQVVTALLDRGMRVAYVSHLSEFTRRTYDEGRPDALFLRADRLPDGTRTFRVLPGEPEETSYGQDLYAAVFGPMPAETPWRRARP